MSVESVGTPVLWIGFIAFILVMLALDLGVFHRKSHVVSLKEAGIWTGVWVALASIFAVGMFLYFGKQQGLEFTTGYLVEKALAIDNIFVFVIIFKSFAIPAKFQHRVLFWGVLGALVMRALFIFAGSAFVQRFHWAIYVFGGILVITGIRLLFQKTENMHPESGPIVKAFVRFFPVTTNFNGDKFLTKINGKHLATPMLLALVAIEASDLMFAVDSIPAIFAITSDPFIIFTSNIFAILGLRSMYFLLADIITRFGYLKIGLSLVLVFVGVKMLLTDVYKIPIGWSLAGIATILGLSIVASLIWAPSKASS